MVQDTEKRDKQNPMHRAQVSLLYILIFIIIIWLLVGFIFGFKIAPNNDMYPRIDSGDLLLYYRWGVNPNARDVIILKKNKTTYVGRVVAKEGDTVNVSEEYGLMINGHTAFENNIYSKTYPYKGFVKYPVKLKKDQYFVLVDSREDGEDSRYYGVVSKDEIEGTVITIIRRSNL